MLQFLPYSILQWLTSVAEYLFSGAAIALGLYLYALLNLADANPLAWIIKPLRYVGLALVIGGVAYGYGTYRESKGAAKCQTAWRQKNLELQNANLARDLKAAQAGQDAQQQIQNELAEQKATADSKVADYENSVKALSASLSLCRRASADDDARLCNILGDAAAGCKPSH